MPRMSLVPTATVTPEPACFGINTELTVLKALVPLIVPVVAMVVTKFEVIVLPSIFVPVTTMVQDWTEAAVPPIVTDNALGTSGLVIESTTVVSAELEALVAANTAVDVPAATFFWVSV